MICDIVVDKSLHGVIEVKDMQDGKNVDKIFLPACDQYKTMAPWTVCQVEWPDIRVTFITRKSMFSSEAYIDLQYFR